MADSVAIPDVAGHETARTPLRFRDRVILAFRAPPNIEYLRGLFSRRVPPGPMRSFALDTLADSVYEYSNNYGRALEILADDPPSRRDGVRPAVTLWGEVRRLNRVYFSERLDFFREHAHLLERVPPAGEYPTGLRDGISEDDEPYHIRMFTEDSLRPDGWEHFNGDGPLYAILEDQARTPRPGREPSAMGPPGGPAPSRPSAGSSGAPSRAAPRAGSSREPSRAGSFEARGRPSGAGTREGFAGGMSNWGRAGPSAPPPGGWGHGFLKEPAPEPPLWVPADTEVFMYGAQDAPWSAGNPDRTPEQAVFEYWNDDGKAATDDGVAWDGADGDGVSWGHWSGSNGSRFDRWGGEIPFWQKGGRDGYDLDIEETLGTAARETDNPVRRWDMDRLREPRGQEYRRYGVRSGHMT